MLEYGMKKTEIHLEYIGCGVPHRSREQIWSVWIVSAENVRSVTHFRPACGARASPVGGRTVRAWPPAPGCAALPAAEITAARAGLAQLLPAGITAAPQG